MNTQPPILGPAESAPRPVTPADALQAGVEALHDALRLYRATDSDVPRVDRVFHYLSAATTVLLDGRCANPAERGALLDLMALVLLAMKGGRDGEA